MGDRDKPIRDRRPSETGTGKTAHRDMTPRETCRKHPAHTEKVT